MIIWVSGTPGVGKTVVGEALAQKLGYSFIDLPQFVKREKIYESYDRARKSYTVGVGRVRKALQKERLKNCVISSHFVLPGLNRDEKCIVLRLNPLLLWRRLEKRGYNVRKITENVEAEFVGIVFLDALAALGRRRVYQIDVTGKNMKQIVAKCVKILNGEAEGDSVDWLTNLTEKQSSKLLKALAQARLRKR
ncbi:MAG: adenylate kinase family protein [Candidatus Caldarchaeum sp.]